MNFHKGNTIDREIYTHRENVRFAQEKEENDNKQKLAGSASNEERFYRKMK